MIVTAEISVYPGQATVTRDFIINTNILRADTQYLNIDSTGAGDFLARGAEFTYDVQLQASETEGFSVPVAPVYNNIEYSYSVVLQSGDVSPTENILITENAPQYQIHPETESLESTVTITTTIGHDEGSGYVEDKVIEKNILIKTRTFDLTYVANGGKVTANADGATVTVRTYYEDAPLFGDITATRDGYTFEGWYLDEALTEKYTGSIMPQNNLTLYAKWNINSYNVSFESNGGSSVSEQIVNYNDLATKPDDPTRDKYLFKGWYKDSGLTTAWDFSSDKITKDTKLYAKWQLNEYTVTFNGNGGIPATTSKKVVYGGTVTPPTVTRDYYNFTGWFTDSSCKTVWSTSSTITKNITLYAGWTLKPIKGWVKASALPSGAQVTERKWTYTLREYTTSGSSSLSGWTKYDTKRTGWTGWSGWNTWNPDNGVRNVEWRSNHYKTQYHYYRYYNGYGMYTYPYNSTYKKEEAYFDWILGNAPGYTDIKSTNGSYDKSTWWCQANLNYAHNFTGKCFEHPCYRDEWRYQDPIYTYYFYRDLSKESSSKPSGSNISNIQEYVKYREK